ncbi:MAG TPA: hypothetical protein VFG12_12080 [Rhodopila sp.]|jgi:hypothetical protein|nr:hypothetical protein [Rhodopila sp.]
MPDDQDASPAHLSHAGAVVDKAIEYMMGQNLSSLAIASALLGGSLALLARSMSDEAIVGILTNAIGSVRSGELREHQGADGVP